MSLEDPFLQEIILFSFCILDILSFKVLVLQSNLSSGQDKQKMSFVLIHYCICNDSAKKVQTYHEYLKNMIKSR